MPDTVRRGNWRTRASELGINALTMPTNGKAGDAWAASAARAGLRMVVAMPKDALALLLITGAGVIYPDAFEPVAEQ